MKYLTNVLAGVLSGDDDGLLSGCVPHYLVGGKVRRLVTKRRAGWASVPVDDPRLRTSLRHVLQHGLGNFQRWTKGHR